MSLTQLSLFSPLNHLFIYFRLPWVFVAALGLSLDAVSRGYSKLWCAGFSYQQAQALGLRAL